MRTYEQDKHNKKIADESEKTVIISNPQKEKHERHCDYIEER